MAKVQEYSKGLSNIMLIIKGCHYRFSLYLFALYFKYIQIITEEPIFSWQSSFLIAYSALNLPQH